MRKRWFTEPWSAARLQGRATGAAVRDVRRRQGRDGTHVVPPTRRRRAAAREGAPVDGLRARRAG